MENKKLYMFLLISFSLVIFTIEEDFKELELITFKTDEQMIEVIGAKKFRIPASFEHKENYLYIYPLNMQDENSPNKAVAKMYFKEYSENDNDVSYLNSDYSTIDFNTGLFIKLSGFKYNKANIFIISYETCNFLFRFKYASSVTFPSYNYWDNFHFNQFTLPKKDHMTVKFQTQPQRYYDFISVISKTSLRNVDIKVTFNGEDYTYKRGLYLYPNGYSFFYDRQVIEKSITVDFINNNNHDEILLLGYNHFIPERLFPDPITNGFQLYLEGNSSTITYLLKDGGSTKKEQYYTYQTNSKNYKMIFVDSRGYDQKTHTFDDFNSLFHYNLDTGGKVRFRFDGTPKRTGLYFQYLDFSNIKDTQKIVGALVSGNPKSLYLPSKLSLFHFLPKERESSVIHYYLRPRSSERLYASLKRDNSCPEKCYFEGKGEEKDIMLFIDNIGLWFDEPTSKTDLQLLYVYCEYDCSYDVIMTYDDDPFFLFPDNNYTKFLGEKPDTFLLPVYEYLNTYEEIRIDLTVLNGNANLTLYTDKGDNKLKYTPQIIGNKQSYVISKNIFADENNGYFKKEIFAVVEGDKNSFYNLMYSSGPSLNKTIENNKVVVESLTVLNKTDNTTSTFTFKNNKEVFYISISTPTCKSNVTVDKVVSTGYQHNFEIRTKGDVNVQILLINDGVLCNQGFKEEVTLFSYSKDDTNIILGQNTLVNSTFYGNEFSFTHLFKPIETKNADNSFSIDTELLSLNTTVLTLSYSLERKSFNRTESKDKNFTYKQSIISNGNTIITDKQVNEICNSLGQNEICILTLNFTSSSDSSIFSVFLNKNGNKFTRKVPTKTLVSSANSKNVQYYYIDLDKNSDTEVIINSYEQDLEIAKKLYSGDNQTGEADLPTEFGSSTNYLNIIQPSVKDCKTYCRLYLAIRVPQDYNKNQLFTTFSINYLSKKDKKPETFINLPLNYYSQYSFSGSDLNEVSYYVNNLNARVQLKLEVIKQNENDNSVVTATLSGTSAKSLSSSNGILNEVLSTSLKITVTCPEDSRPAYRLELSTIGKTDNPVIPVISSHSEKCKTKICYYTVDITPDIEKEYAFFYVPEVEKAVISLKKVSDAQDAIKHLNDKEYDESSKSAVKRTNWHQHKLPDQKGYTLIVKVEKDTEVVSTLVTSYHNKPNKVTLDYGDKRMFVIAKSSDIKNILFKINKKGTSANKQYKVNIHVIRGNGLFKYKNEKYPLGMNETYKEDMSIFLDISSDNVELNVTNERDEKADTQDFVFSIEYTMDTKNKIVNKLVNNKINSYKIVSEKEIGELIFYMEANKVTKDFSMNIKVYSSDATYEIKSFVNEEDYLNKIMENKYKNEEKVGEVKTIVKGGKGCGELSFSRLKIPYKTFSGEKKLFVYVIVNQKSGSNTKVKVDLYPYDLTNNVPLALNELFVETIPGNTDNYQLLLTRSDIDYSQDIKISMIRPASSKYEIGISQDDVITDKKIREVETGIKRTEKGVLGRKQIMLYPKEKRYIFFNVYADKYELEEKDDLLVFRYRNPFSSEDDLYFLSKPSFEVEGTQKNITFKFSDIQAANTRTGKIIYIFNAYKTIDIADVKTEDEFKPLYLFFSDKKPSFSMYYIAGETDLKIRKKTTTDFEPTGEFYFTCIAVIEDNEKEQFLAFSGLTMTVSNPNLLGGFLDYFDEHLLSCIIIIIILLFLIGMMVNICRAERKHTTSIKIEGSSEMKNIDAIMDNE